MKLNVRTGELVPLLDDPGGAVRDPVVHYDGGTILFSYRKAGSHHYHLYEIGVDGSKLRQLTDGPFDDIEPPSCPTVFYGNMHAGGVFIDARPIPDSEELVLINSPGHGRNEHAGYVALLSGKRGPDDQRALQNITGSADFHDPYPLSADRFLVARGNQLLLMDRQGAGQVIYTGEQMVHEPRALRPRRREVLVPPRSDRQQAKATLLLADVYTGRNMEGVAPGTIERRCGQCHPAARFPQHVTAQTRIDPWGDLLSWQRPLSRYSRHRIYNLSRPEQSLVLRVPLARDAGGDAESPQPEPDDLRPVAEDRSGPPPPVTHPVIFRDTSEPDYQAILAHVVAAGEKLDHIKRFDMPEFVPNEFQGRFKAVLVEKL